MVKGVVEKVHDRLSVALAANYNPETAHNAGFFDELTDPDELMACAGARARAFEALESTCLGEASSDD